MSSADLMVLPGATIREGLDNLGLATVTPIRDDVEGKRQGNHRDHDNSLAACEGCEWSARRCPLHWPERYAKQHARHSTEVSA